MPAYTRPGQFHISLRPAEGGAFTEWRIAGSTPTGIPAWQLSRLMQAVSFWSGWPVALVLPVAPETDLWFSWWAGALADIPSDQLRVTYAVCPVASEEHDDG